MQCPASPESWGTSVTSLPLPVIDYVMFDARSCSRPPAGPFAFSSTLFSARFPPLFPPPTSPPQPL
eukprot:166723-Pyramimonas_sp.AAC.1